MYYLTLNPGSSSLKYALFDSGQNNLIHGKIARINEGKVEHRLFQKDTIVSDEEVQEYKLNSWVKYVFSSVNDFIKKIDEGENPTIKSIIRTVHDGGMFDGPVLVEDEVIEKLQSIVTLAPLHLPLTLEVIAELKKFTSSDMWLVFDTHFHKTLPREALTTGLPYLKERDFRIRRYGFHGLSHHYVSKKITEKYGSDHAILSCHLGSGASICAIKNGQSIQTTMGFGPGSGLMMGTRSGDVDWEALLYFMDENQFGTKEARDMLYKHSGILGMTGTTDLMPEVIEHDDQERFQNTIKQFVYRIVMSIGSYLPLFGTKPTHIVFTGGIGSGSYVIREAVLYYFTHLGWIIDTEKNQKLADVVQFEELHKPESQIKIVTFATDEESVMVAEVCKLAE